MRLYVSRHVLLESGFSVYRFQKYLQEEKPFGIITAWKYDEEMEPEELEEMNKRRNKELEKDLRRYGLGFYAKAKGVWGYAPKSYKGVPWNKIPDRVKNYVEEDVFIVGYPPNWKGGDVADFIDTLMKLGKKYEQEGIIVAVPPEEGANLKGVYLIELPSGRYHKFSGYSFTRALKAFKDYTKFPRKSGPPIVVAFT